MNLSQQDREYVTALVVGNLPQQNVEYVTALVIGDPHFKVSNVKETDAMVEAIIRTATERQPDIIIVLGDVLDRHEIIHVSPLTRATKFLGRLMNIAPTYVLIGNHDLKNNRQFLSDEHPFTALKFWGENMIIVDKTTMVNIKGQTFVFAPYVPPGRFEEALNRCPGWEKATCIFGHQEFRGSQMGAIISTEGDVWPLTNPYVVTGHIHDYQEPQVNILYTGTPIQHGFGDRHDKSISYFTYHSPINRDHERIDLGLPRKYIVRLTCAEVSTYVPQTNCELKIVIRGTSGEIKAIMKHHNIEIWKRQGYKIAYKDIPLDKADSPDYSEINDENKQVISKAPLRFSIVLYNSVSNNQRLAPLYNRIFGSVRLDNVSPQQYLSLSTSTNESFGGNCLTLKVDNLATSIKQLNISPESELNPTKSTKQVPTSIITKQVPTRSPSVTFPNQIIQPVMSTFTPMNISLAPSLVLSMKSKNTSSIV